MAVVFFAALAFFVYKKSTVSVAVKTESVPRRDFELTVTATSTGTIKSDMEINITAQRTGRISRLAVVEGDAVKEGQPVAEIDPKETEINLGLATASLEKAKAYLEQLRASLKALEADVETGVQSAGARLKEVEDRYERLKGLHKEGYVSNMEFDATESEYSVAKADYEAALSRRETLEAKRGEIKAQEASVKEARNNLALAELTYGYSFVKAPATGIITSRPVKLGETVVKGTLIAVLITTDSLYIESFVDEADVGKVNLGQSVRVTMDAYPESVFPGEVYKISPVVLGGRLEARTFEVRTRLREEDVALKPGMSAEVEIMVEDVKGALVIQSQAVMTRDGKKFVYVNDKDRAALREIVTGLSDWTYTEVMSGLKEGEEVVVTPDAPGLKAGSRIRVEEPGS